MGNNSVCLGEIQNNAPRQGSPDTKWKREDLKSGSCVQTLMDKENTNFFKMVQCGPSTPYYKNEHSATRWAQAISTLKYVDDIQTTINLLYNRSEFEELVLLGPPKQYRWATWKALLTNGQIQLSYEKYLEYMPIDEKSILKDIDRTLVNHALFKHESCGQEQLKRILFAISNALPGVGYCQGMNFVCALTLIVSGCDEHKTFQCFMQMLTNEKHLLCFNFCHDMPMHFFFTKLIHHLIRKKFPKLNLKNVNDSLWISKMILSLFIYVFKLDDCIRCWDYLMVRGMIRGIPELILGFIDVTYKQLEQFKEEDYGFNFQGHESSIIQFNVGELIYAAKQKHSIDRQLISRLAMKMRKNKPSQLLDLLSHFENIQTYRKHVQFYMKTIFDLY
ncbi:unnamed protein product [Paramecium octaurelia]|uniref:Rab-GAP TBC domain-containing protein n=1 Tax=Paramecium octaurelia TaxID=43137 RepID=A0A8S1YJ42_PAROT|nr:unnamed protein product [Paramecium octaurelia]